MRIVDISARYSNMKDDPARAEVLLRIPVDMLEKLDAYAAEKAAKFTKPSRTATILHMIEKSLRDAERTR